MKTAKINYILSTKTTKPYTTKNILIIISTKINRCQCKIKKTLSTQKLKKRTLLAKSSKKKSNGIINPYNFLPHQNFTAFKQPWHLLFQSSSPVPLPVKNFSTWTFCGKNRLKLWHFFFILSKFKVAIFKFQKRRTLEKTFLYILNKTLQLLWPTNFAQKRESQKSMHFIFCKRFLKSLYFVMQFVQI